MHCRGGRGVRIMILPEIRDKRFITIRRGGTLTDNDHNLMALWTAECVEHVLHLFETACPNDDRPRNAIKATRAWANGETSMTISKSAAGASQDAARNEICWYVFDKESWGNRMNRKTFEYEAVIKPSDTGKGGAYVPFPYGVEDRE